MNVSVDQQPQHYTRQPWWVILIGAVAAPVVVLLKYGQLQMRAPGTGFGTAMFNAAWLGALGSAILMVRSHIRSPFWANVILWVGIVVGAVGACLVLAW